uniref:DUF4283 domain-containing protein n=1 Tax=Angiostrongylus cantonensis TaxID=6313 RepID=A0A0K0D9Y7_ANGCA
MSSETEHVVELWDKYLHVSGARVSLRIGTHILWKRNCTIRWVNAVKDMNYDMVVGKKLNGSPMSSPLLEDVDVYGVMRLDDEIGQFQSETSRSHSLVLAENY